MPTKSGLQNLLEIVQKFVVKQKGAWEHDDWEALVAHVTKAGVCLDDDEGKRNLGNILEACKFFYFALPADVEKKKPAPKKKASGK
jgi:hypothetical protein